MPGINSLSSSSPIATTKSPAETQRQTPALSLNNMDEARGYVAALNIRFKDQFAGALGDLAAKVGRGEMDNDSFLRITAVMVDASHAALSR